MKNKGYFFSVIVACLLLISCATHSRETAFETWKQQFAGQAVAAGVDQSFVNSVLPQMQLLPQVLESDRKQPEFRATFWDYTDRTLSTKRIETGREMMKKHADLLASVEQKYGVPAKYIVAFWGLETAYGSYKGNIETLNALATMAFDERRRPFFTKELIAFLKIMQQENLTDVKGSWAGAFGNFQFMPTTFAAYGVDGDGDGRRDIVNSLPDAMESAANYLSRIGWDKNVKWGREVKLPAQVDWTAVYAKTKRPIKEWNAMGIKPARGVAWPSDALQIPAKLVMPMGINGPAFLVYSNYDVIMRWNRSQLYALSIGLLSDALIMGEVQIYAPRQNSQFSYDQGKEIQDLLTKMGYYTGEIDGILGSGTQKAIRAYQKDHSLPQDGYATVELLNKMKGL